MIEVLHALTAIFGALALLALVATGFVMMFSPAAGRRIQRDGRAQRGWCGRR